MRKLAVLTTVAATLTIMFAATVAAPPAGATHRAANRMRVVRSQASSGPAALGVPGPTSPIVREAQSRGYLTVPGFSKSSDTAIPDGVRASGVAPRTTLHLPHMIAGWNGVFDPSVTPPDTAGAAGPLTYVELVNDTWGIYNRPTRTLIASGALSDLLGVGASDCISTPQVFWDPYTNAFYFSVLDYGVPDGDGNCPTGQETLYYGWSTTSDPLSGTSSDWCVEHTSSYGAAGEFPDFGRLGDTQDFGLIGVNVYFPDTASIEDEQLRADVVAFPKPAPGDTATCPATQTLTTFQNLSDSGAWDPGTWSGGIPAFTPVPAVQTDPSSTGSIVSAVWNGNAGPFNPSGGAFLGNQLAVFTVTNDAGTPAISPARVVTLRNSFMWPTNAPQRGNPLKLDTLDGRLTNAFTGWDGVHGMTSGAGALWTQMTARGGKGAGVRWFEINPGTGTVAQGGLVVGTTNWLFDAAISPDRRVVADATGAVTTRQYGGSFVLSFNASSSAIWVQIHLASKLGTAALHGGVNIKSSTGPENDFSCHDTLVCRWGDYSAASPDPGPSTTGHGHVWLANAWSVTGATGTDVDWRTFIAHVNP
jgi:hypothetical protein